LSRALTCDVEGCLRLWAIERSVGSRALCLALFDVQSTVTTVKPKAFVVAWDLSVVLSANGLWVLESVRTRRKEVPSAVGFSEARSEFFVMHSKTAVIVEAADGRLKKNFNYVHMADVTACELDKSSSRVVAGDITGAVGIIRTLNLNRIADVMENRHDGEVTGVKFDHDHNIIISVGVDKRICVFDGELGESRFAVEGDKVHRLELLRCVQDSHDRDITCLAFSPR
jgi:WD40 repeat protein